MDYYMVELVIALLAPRSKFILQLTRSVSIRFHDLHACCSNSINTAHVFPCRMTLIWTEKQLCRTSHTWYAWCLILGSIEYIVLVEHNFLFEFRNIRDAYVMLFACYFTFNIQYPPLLSCALLFIQHYIYSLPVGTKKLPISITRVYSACAKM